MGNPNMVPIFFFMQYDVFEFLNRVVLSNCYQTGFLCIYSILSQIYVLWKEYDNICAEMPLSFQWYTANGETAVNILISKFEGSELYLLSVYQQ